MQYALNDNDVKGLRELADWYRRNKPLLPFLIKMAPIFRGGGGDFKIEWGKITQTLVYADPLLAQPEGISYYKVQLLSDSSIKDIDSVWQKENGDVTDMREYVPWFAINEIVPLVKKNVGSPSVEKYFIWVDFIFVSTPADCSVMWNETENRLMSVFK